MTTLVILIGVLLLFAGLLAMLCPEKAWRRLMPLGSRWSNQASTTAFFIFGGLGWIGLTVFVINCGGLWVGWRSQQWSEVSGTVVESRLVETRQVRSTNPAYRPQVVYRYEIEGRELRGDQVDAVASSTGDRAWVEELLHTRYAPGASVAVFVDPDDPTRSLLEPGVQANAIIFVVLGMVFVAIASWQLRALVRDWNGDRVIPPEARRRNRRMKR